MQSAEKIGDSINKQQNFPIPHPPFFALVVANQLSPAFDSLSFLTAAAAAVPRCSLFFFLHRVLSTRPRPLPPQISSFGKQSVENMGVSGLHWYGGRLAVSLQGLQVFEILH